MKKRSTNFSVGNWMLLIGILFLIIFSACQKETDRPEIPSEIATKANNEAHGHLKQTKEYSSEVVFKWIDMQLRLIRTNNPQLGGLLPGRFFGYCGIALYESVVPGMPAYQSLAGQLNGMPEMTRTEPGLAYHWPTVANAALAYMNRNFFPSTSTINKQAIDSLENALNLSYQSEINDEIFQRSIQFGKAIATAVFNWSATDGSSNANAPYTAPTGPGLWVPTPPNFAPANLPYWGNNRLMVAGSLNGTAPSLPIPYSTDPSSDFFKMEKEVYDISQSLTPEQTALALYFRDNPGYGGGHFLAILGQVLQQEQATLDVSAFAYAKTGISNVDAGIACWQIKFTYNVERPITFIRTIMGHPTWSSLFPAPNHPDYPSGHSTAAGAFAEAMTSIFGDNYHFTEHTYDYLGMAPLTYNSFYELAGQVSNARVYAGIHSFYACNEAKLQGIKIARNINNKLNFLKE